VTTPREMIQLRQFQFNHMYVNFSKITATHFAHRLICLRESL